MALELEKKNILSLFYHSDLHIYINIWRFCSEKAEVKLLKQNSVVLLIWLRLSHLSDLLLRSDPFIHIKNTNTDNETFPQ